MVSKAGASPDESFADLAIKASREALDDAAINPLDIDMILFCGIERDCPEPSTAHTIQAVLGAVNAECLDVSNACLGALNGLSVANAYIGAQTQSGSIYIRYRCAETACHSL